MDDQDSKEKQESIRLAEQAVREKIETGKVSVICPKCQKHPEVNIGFLIGERTTVICPCKYIMDK